VLLTFATGDYLAPVADRTAQLLKTRYQGRITVGQTGAWIKERQTDNAYTVNVGALSPDGDMLGVRIFEFDAKGALVSQTQAPQGRVCEDGAWLLRDAERSELAGAGTDTARMKVEPGVADLPLAHRDQPGNGVSGLLKPDRMSTMDLFQYIRHLDANGQTSQRYEIEFWRKVFYPLSCLVMVVLACHLPTCISAAAALPPMCLAGC
jgi:lipopolysaccharide export system permease protein